MLAIRCALLAICFVHDSIGFINLLDQGLPPIAYNIECINGHSVGIAFLCHILLWAPVICIICKLSSFVSSLANSL